MSMIGRLPRLRSTSSARWMLDEHDEINADLRAWLPLDEPGGTQAFDLSLHARHGGLSATRARSDWKYGRAFACVSPNELVNVGGPSSIASTSLLGLDGRAGNFAVCCWVNFSSTSLSGAFFGLGSATTGVGLGVGTTTVDTAGGNIVGLYQGVRWVPTGFAFATGWHFLALSLNASGHPTIWFDRTAVYSDTIGAPGALASGYCFIGTSQLGARFCTASIAHFRVLGRPIGFADVDRMVGDPWSGALAAEDRMFFAPRRAVASSRPFLFRR